MAHLDKSKHFTILNLQRVLGYIYQIHFYITDEIKYHYELLLKNVLTNVMTRSTEKNIDFLKAPHTLFTFGYRIES